MIEINISIMSGSVGVTFVVVTSHHTSYRFSDV